MTRLPVLELDDCSSPSTTPSSSGAATADRCTHPAHCGACLSWRPRPCGRSASSAPSSGWAPHSTRSSRRSAPSSRAPSAGSGSRSTFTNGNSGRSGSTLTWCTGPAQACRPGLPAAADAVAALAYAMARRERVDDLAVEQLVELLGEELLVEALTVIGYFLMISDLAKVLEPDA